MAAPMWRMNGVWKRMAGVLLLCTLLCNDVTCQDDAVENITHAPETPDSDAPTIAAPLDATSAPAAGSTVTNDRTSASSTEFYIFNNANNQDGHASETTAAPSVEKMVSASPENREFEETKRIIQDHPVFCEEKPCELKLLQIGKELYGSSEQIDQMTLKSRFQDEPLKAKLMRSPSSPSSSDSSVFAGLLSSGLIGAAALLGGYFICQRRSGTKGVRLADDAYPVDQENQGNTLVSVAPLNPPPETTEKPSVNGESPEAVKTEPAPPTNGHSTTNTADTEM